MSYVIRLRLLPRLNSFNSCVFFWNNNQRLTIIGRALYPSSKIGFLSLSQEVKIEKIYLYLNLTLMIDKG